MRLAAGLGLIGLLAAQDLPRAAAALEAGKFDEAVATLSDLLRRAPDDPEANYYMGLAYFRAERPREARPYLERATQLSPARAEAWQALGLALLKTSDYAPASLALGRACALKPKDEDACYLQGRSLFIQGRYDEAVGPLENAVRTGGNKAAAHRAAAMNYAELGRASEAEGHFRDAIALHRAGSGQADPRVDYGAFLTAQGRAQDAVKVLTRAIAEASPSARALSELGRALLELDRPGDAVPALERAVALDPNGWSVRMMLGKAYLRLGRTVEGERELRLGREGWAKQDYGSSRNK
ncbi:MAG TPA: tetratricopeptide repeat protein [Bryobacteraceae bacterium]|jgi:Flp pilus assembly protein TadD